MPRKSKMIWKKGDSEEIFRNEVNETENFFKTGKKRPAKNQKTSKLDPKALEKYSRGDGIKNNFHLRNHDVTQKKIFKRETTYKWAEHMTARAEVLLTENAGYLEVDEGESTSSISQQDLRKNVDITSAAKNFQLNLSFGPYRLNYSRSGRHLLLGGKLGHIAAFDWITKKLLCEINVMESVFDISWLHNETMFAAAQKNYLYIYDNQGVELHCIKRINQVLRLTFLPYHFLLVSSSENGWLKWLDVSVGDIVQEYNTKQGRLDVMVQNPYNAIICCGHAKGVVTMWSPNSYKPEAQLLCHNNPVKSIAIDHTGTYMATTATNCQMKIWDVRSLNGCLHQYKLNSNMRDLCFSQRHFLAGVMKDYTIEIYRGATTGNMIEPYLKHRCKDLVNNLEFCPHEDILGTGTSKSFISLLIPGAGEPNYDAFEQNPMQTKSQRREAEVKSLLEKIQPEMITLDPFVLTEVDLPTLKNKIEAKQKLLYIKPPKIDFTQRKNKKGNRLRLQKNKKIMQEKFKKGFIRQIKEAKQQVFEKEPLPKPTRGVLDRFKSKVKSK